MWVACTGEDTHELAGRLGLGLLSFTLLVSPERLGKRVQAYRTAIQSAKPYGAFVNNQAGAFAMTHVADTDKQAKEEAARSFMSYVRTTLVANAPVIEAKKTGVDPQETGRLSTALPRSVRRPGSEQGHHRHADRQRDVRLRQSRHRDQADRAATEKSAARSVPRDDAVLGDPA